MQTAISAPGSSIPSKSLLITIPSITPLSKVNQSQLSKLPWPCSVSLPPASHQSHNQVGATIHPTPLPTTLPITASAKAITDGYRTNTHPLTHTLSHRHPQNSAEYMEQWLDKYHNTSRKRQPEFSSPHSASSAVLPSPIHPFTHSPARHGTKRNKTKRNETSQVNASTPLAESIPLSLGMHHSSRWWSLQVERDGWMYVSWAGIFSMWLVDCFESPRSRGAWCFVVSQLTLFWKGSDQAHSFS